MQKKFGAELKTPNDLSVPEYEAVYAYKAAAEKAGSTEQAKVLKALGEVSVEGPRGKIEMSEAASRAIDHVSRPGAGRRLGEGHQELSQCRSGRAVPEPEVLTSKRRRREEGIAFFRPGSIRFARMITLALDIVTTAAILFIVSAGLLIVFGVMKIINFAHASFITVGAYAALVASRLGLPPVLAPALAFLAGGLIGAVAERVVVRRLYGRPLDAILATWGLSIVIGQLVTLGFGREVQFVPAPISGHGDDPRRGLFGLSSVDGGGGDRDRRPVHRASQRHAARSFHTRRDHERDAGARLGHRQHAGPPDHLRHRLRSRRDRRRPDHAAGQRRSQYGAVLADRCLHAGDDFGRLAADARTVVLRARAACRCWPPPSSARSSAD